MLGTRETPTTRDGCPRGPRARRGRLVGCAFASVLALAAQSAAGQTPQVTIYMGGYGGEPPPSAPPVTAPANGAGGAYQGPAALAQLALYQQYLVYLAVANSSQPSGPPPDPKQYFTNGAAVTTVPSAGQPGAGYFSNGAEATRLPLAPPVASAASSSYAAPARQAPLQPFWWVEPDTKQAASPPPAPSAAPAPPVAAAPAAVESPGAPMSFEEWLTSMGAVLPEAEAAELPAPPAPADEESAPVAEPSATAYEVRQRASYVDREKPRERAAANGTSKGLAAVILGAFGVGLVMGAVAMRRARLAMAARPRGTSPDLARR